MNVQGAGRTTAVATADNATATATLAAAGSGFKWLVKAWNASFAPAAPAATVVCTVTINGVAYTRGVSATTPWDVDKGTDGILSEENGQPSIALAASGTGTQLGRVCIEAIKVPANFTF
jgi:hypothetical protein